MHAPDGYETPGIFVNGQFPGPAIEADWGDWIEVRVHNNIGNSHGAKAEGTSIHFHGMLQKETQWSDGVPGVTQCPIAPGSSFTYRFRADVYGTSWWHSHFSAQYTAGVWGPLIIHGPRHVDHDVDVGPVMLGDFYHRDSTDFNVYVPWSDNSLINGKNSYNCSMAAANATCHSDAALSEFRFQPGKTHRLRLMNTGAAALLHFSIDQHRMTVIANDFEPVVPYEADYITLHVGQRTDILVKGDADPDLTYWMRSTISLNCSVSHSTQGRAIVGYDVLVASSSSIGSYQHRKPLRTPNSTISPAAAKADEKSFLCRNDDLSRTVPFYPQAVDPNPGRVETIVVDLFTNGTGQHVWIMNNAIQRTNYNQPLLLDAYRSGTLDRFLGEHPEQRNAHLALAGGHHQTVRIVLNTPYQSAHPMHLHGHRFQVLSEGPGGWDGHTIVNPQNPLRRDTHLQTRYGHLVIQFTTDSPGVWSYHCHIAWHASMGLNIMLLEGVTS
ncbi:Bclcc9 [Apiospora saccharicola]